MQRAEQSALAHQVAQAFGLSHGAPLIHAYPGMDAILETADLLQTMVYQLAWTQLALTDQLNGGRDVGKLERHATRDGCSWSAATCRRFIAGMSAVSKGRVLTITPVKVRFSGKSAGSGLVGVHALACHARQKDTLKRELQRGSAPLQAGF